MLLIATDQENASVDHPGWEGEIGLDWRGRLRSLSMSYVIATTARY